MRRNYRFDYLLTILLAVLPSICANASEQKQSSFCELILALDSNLLKGAIQKPKEVKKIFEATFPERNRKLLVFQYSIKGHVPRPIYFNKNKLRYVLIATDQNRVVWHFEEFIRHVPTVFTLSPTNSNVGFIAKKVERFYPSEEAPPSATERPEYSKNLSSDSVFEVLKIYLEQDGQLRFSDLYTSTDKIHSLGFDINMNLRINESITVPSE